MADEDLFRYLWAVAVGVGLLMLLFYAVSAWQFLRKMRGEEEINYQSPTIRKNLKRVK